MHFCENCDFVLHTRLGENDDPSIGATPRLQHYCKNCMWSSSNYFDAQIANKKSICMYEKKYTNEYVAMKAIKNPYTIYDPTLPRVSNIACINQNCLTNQSQEDLNKYVLIQNISFYDTEVKTEIVKQLQSYLSQTKQTASVDFTVHKMNNNSVFVNCQSADTAEKILEHSQHSITVYGKEYSLTKCESVEREIIFIKYDPDNLKYLYLCSACTTSWKSQ